MGTRAAIYCRISDDRAGQGLGVERQRKACLELLEAKGWQVVTDPLTGSDTFTDNDVSAYSGRKRKAYLRLVESMRRGEVDVVVAWHPDRIHRHPRELEDFIDVLEAQRIGVTTVQAGTWDLTTPAGRMTARVLGAVARKESEHKAERQKEKTLELAAAGRHHGMLRTYGYQGTAVGTGKEKTYKWRVIEAEAEVIREAARRVFDGDALWAIVTDFNARGLTTMNGKPWRRMGLRQILCSARIAGWRSHTPGRTRSSHNGEYDGAEFVAQGDWPAILTKDEVERLRQKLCAPERRMRTSPRSYLLSGGLLRCTCGRRMSGRPVAGKSYDREYWCPKQDGGCGHRHVRADTLEQYVIDFARTAVETPALDAEERGRADETVDVLVEKIRTLTTEIEELAALRGARRISTQEWLAAADPLKAELAQAQQEYDARRSGSGPRRPASVQEWDRRWAAAGEDVNARRLLLSSVIDFFEVLPARNTKFDPDRFVPTWRR